MLFTMSKPDIYTLAHGQGILVIILDLISLFTFIVGLAGYQANFIQLGLDQLFEAPSPCLGLFIHYAIWAFSLGSLYFLMTAYFFFFFFFFFFLSIIILAILTKDVQ